MTQLISVAAIQMTSGQQLSGNLEAASALLEQAANGGAQLAVLPENFAVYGGDYRNRCSPGRLSAAVAVAGSRCSHMATHSPHTDP